MPTKSKTPAPLTPELTTSAGYAMILQHNMEYLLQWEQTARSWENIEGVHQVRVSLRRIRSAITLFRTAIPKSATKTLRKELQWVSGQLGLARDLDVFIDEGLCAIEGKLPFKGQKRLMLLARKHREKAYRDQVCKMLDSDRYARFKADFIAWYSNRAWEQADLEDKHRKHLESNLVQYARDLLDKQERVVLNRGSNIDRHAPEQMHRLRIECKKLRYAADFFQPIFNEMSEFIAHLKGIQDILGVMNDVSIMHNLLEVLLADSNEHELLEYAGALVGWRTCQFYYLLNGFDQQWDQFTETGHPWWKKSALRSA
ncbi:MAG: CHAD domain-containing protein [Gammaproteobacteria bacterium]|nr:CHAD domain-containing protein [Gammaproteobacteria bacterium]